MFLGIEIGGTKLQLGVGAGDGSPNVVELRRLDVDAGDGAGPILEGIERVAGELIGRALRAGESVSALADPWTPPRGQRRQKPPGRRLGGFSAGRVVPRALAACRLRWETIATWPGLAEARFGAGPRASRRVLCDHRHGRRRRVCRRRADLSRQRLDRRGDRPLAAELGRRHAARHGRGPSGRARDLGKGRGIGARNGSPRPAGDLGHASPTGDSAKDVADAARLGDWRALMALSRAHRRWAGRSRKS